MSEPPQHGSPAALHAMHPSPEGAEAPIANAGVFAYDPPPAPHGPIGEMQAPMPHYAGGVTPRSLPVPAPSKARKAWKKTGPTIGRASGLLLLALAGLVILGGLFVVFSLLE
jgi:hypothetical protein